MQLSPCVACNRHVAVDATSCPFCAAVIAAPATSSDPGRLSRAAVFAFGAATIASTVLGACWTNKSEPQHVQQVTATPDAAVPPPDAAVAKQLGDPDEDRHYQNHPCVDTPQGPMCAPYGAPPARRRLV